jgi:hypothetical protein
MLYVDTKGEDMSEMKITEEMIASRNVGVKTMIRR